ncbi:MAG: SulP family inorganic anion transporter [Nitrospira sp.]|nr:SulP family inorganic anion transporter [Nitrospira sp.]MDH4357827.1 SulP family inorganic anion transporter [Nitrospira sp.]MDH5320327.1 SulP family inorganic anion transporter [Nitrospira sp.]
MDGMSIVTTSRSHSVTENKAYTGPLQTMAAIESAAFQAQYVGRDIAAGLITGVMAIPLSVGIAMMSDYPIKVGLATVAFACLIGWMNA